MWQVVCSHLSGADLSDIQLLQQLHDAVNVYYNYTGSATCFNINETAVGSLDVKGWDFQVCALISGIFQCILVFESFFLDDG